MKPFIALLLLVALGCLSALYAESIVIPELHVPARHLPAVHLPAIHIPARRTALFEIPAIDVPEIYIPAIDIPAIDTTSYSITYDDFTVDQVETYKKTAPKAVLPPPQYSKDEKTTRAEKYLAATPWATAELVRLFTMFDLGSGSLNWGEIERFQQYVYSRYHYQPNSIALRPDAFLAQGGGDCEDFALLSCEFFRFWGWRSFVASFFKANAGHALCFVRAELPVPPSYLNYHLSGNKTHEGDTIPNGTYVPVDYFAVGSFSSAVTVGMKLTEYFTPSRIYGTAM
jgi:hypothetical protein